MFEAEVPRLPLSSLVQADLPSGTFHGAEVHGYHHLLQFPALHTPNAHQEVGIYQLLQSGMSSPILGADEIAHEV